jgi:hypothetical protein
VFRADNFFCHSYSEVSNNVLKYLTLNWSRVFEIRHGRKFQLGAAAISKHQRDWRGREEVGRLGSQTGYKSMTQRGETAPRPLVSQEPPIAAVIAPRACLPIASPHPPPFDLKHRRNHIRTDGCWMHKNTLNNASLATCRNEKRWMVLEFTIEKDSCWYEIRLLLTNCNISRADASTPPSSKSTRDCSTTSLMTFT